MTCRTFSSGAPSFYTSLVADDLDESDDSFRGPFINQVPFRDNEDFLHRLLFFLVGLALRLSMNFSNV